MKPIITLIATLTLAACGEKQPEMSVQDKQKFFNTLEDARALARDNALFNAEGYRSESPRLQGLKIVSHGDSTQSPECPQGDGWATVSFMGTKAVDGSIEKYKAVCSTVSASLGCYLEKDFQEKPFSKQNNRCDPSLPFPLPKIAK